MGLTEAFWFLLYFLLARVFSLKSAGLVNKKPDYIVFISLLAHPSTHFAVQNRSGFHRWVGEEAGYFLLTKCPRDF
jgi:hypothetical protein